MFVLGYACSVLGWVLCLRCGNGFIVGQLVCSWIWILFGGLVDLPVNSG